MGMTAIVDQVGGRSLVLFDGVCGLCQRFIQFVLRHDSGAKFCFCAIQDPFAAPILARHGLDPATLSTICLVTGTETPQERLFLRSDAVAEVLLILGGGWRLPGRLLGLVPRSLRDFGYNLVARTRYRIYGRLASCPLPSASQQGRFLSTR
jgi:predicted DCC family thiol-disulfide oxidoreductase YuxK